MFSIIPYRTNRNMVSRGLFDEFSNDFFRPFFEGGLNSLMRAEPAVKVDVRDEGDRYVLEADLPGMNKDDVKVEVENGVLTLSAEFNQEKEEKGEEDRYVYRERRCGSVRRSFNIDGSREEDITAGFKDGVLRLELPKKETKALPEARTIEIQ